MIGTLSWFLFAFSVILTGSLQGQNVSGHLYRADLKAPIKNARVEVHNLHEGRIIAETSTDRTGAYAIALTEVDPRLTHFLRFHSPGFRGKTVKINLGSESLVIDHVLLSGRIIEPRSGQGLLCEQARRNQPAWTITLDREPPIDWKSGGLRGETVPIPVGDSLKHSPGTHLSFQDLYACSELRLSNPQDEITTLYLATDDGAEAWMNGHQILADLKARRGFWRWNYMLDLTQHLKRGKNILAVHVKNWKGLSFFDALIVKRPAWLWRTNLPPKDWNRNPKLPENAWETGTTPFKGNWPNLYARRVLKVSSKEKSSCVLHLNVRDRADVWINGDLVLEDMPASWALPIDIGTHLRSGDNLVAIQVDAGEGPALLDIEIVTGAKKNERWVQLEGKYVVLKAPPEYAFQLKQDQAWKICDQSYAFFMELFGVRPFQGKPQQFKFDCTMRRRVAVSGNPARFGVAFWKSPPAYWALIHEMLHAFLGMPDFKVLRLNRTFAEVWPPVIASLNFRLLGMDKLADKKTVERIDALEKELSSGKRGDDLSNSAWKGFMMRLLNEKAPDIDDQKKALQKMFALVQRNHQNDRDLSESERWNKLVYYLSNALKSNLTQEFLDVGAPIDAAEIRRMLR